MSIHEELASARQVALTTLDGLGGEVTTAAWVVPLSDGRLGLPALEGSGPRVRLLPCDSRARPLEGAEPREGDAEQVRSGGLFEEARGRLREKYGWRARLPRHRGDMATVLLVRLEQPTLS